MNVFITTVAGKATRFNKDLKTPVLKAIYHQGDASKSLLYRQIDQVSKACEKIIVVGGYLFESLMQEIESSFSQFRDRIELIYNPHFEDYGSMYSLYLGIQAAEKYKPEQVVFAEGDVFCDNASFDKVLGASKDVFTINRFPVYANQSVVAYESQENKLCYIYDTAHNELFFDAPVKAIFNSAQIWKFCDTSRLFQLNQQLTKEQQIGTNLNLIQFYFSDFEFAQLDCVVMEQWVNCNTVEDFLSTLRN